MLRNSVTDQPTDTSDSYQTVSNIKLSLDATCRSNLRDTVVGIDFVPIILDNFQLINITFVAVFLLFLLSLRAKTDHEIQGINNFNHYLVTFQQSFSTCHIRSQFIGSNKTHHGLNPGSKIPVVAQEALQVVWIQQLFFTSVGFSCQLSPFIMNLLLLRPDCICGIRMTLHQPSCCFIQLTNLNKMRIVD